MCRIPSVTKVGSDPNNGPSLGIAIANQAVPSSLRPIKKSHYDVSSVNGGSVPMHNLFGCILTPCDDLFFCQKISWPAHLIACNRQFLRQSSVPKDLCFREKWASLIDFHECLHWTQYRVEVQLLARRRHVSNTRCVR